ncbi:Uncharacterised protein [Vibrio cholerae]|nr:Uncharacterised protein [Vibrio cholerae]CSI51045.1 Uncharacterised protein [Vibrio cholerae]
MYWAISSAANTVCRIAFSLKSDVEALPLR